MFRLNRSVAMAIMASGYAVGAALGSTVVLSNNGVPGDAFTNALGFNMGQAVGTSGFYYNNVRSNGVAGIHAAFPRSGNGSAHLSTAASGSKADIELLPNAAADFLGNWSTGAGASLGRLGDLTALSYEWYRDSSSANNAGQHPVIRLLVETASGARGGLVFERAYNGGGAVPTDAWIFEDVMAYNGGDGANLWSFQAGMVNFEFGYSNSVTDWINGVGTINADTLVIGISMGVGSGWGAFDGAVDNLTIGFNGVNTSYNFEVVPTPGAIALFGVAGAFASRRRRF